MYGDGVYTNGQGYVMQRATTHPRVYPDGYVPQHRLVVEMITGYYHGPQFIIETALKMIIEERI